MTMPDAPAIGNASGRYMERTYIYAKELAPLGPLASVPIELEKWDSGSLATAIGLTAIFVLFRFIATHWKA